jgi:hypothetical protein
VTVSGVADTPDVSANDVSGTEDTAIALDLSAAVTDSSESLTVEITGFPSGISVSHGSVSGGVWTVDAADLGSLEITPPENFSGSMNLQVTATSTDGSDTAANTASFTVTVAADADAPNATAQNVSGDEDSAISLNLSASLTDSSETLSAQITGVPSGASLSAGTDQGGGVWTIDPADLGALTVTPPSDFSGTMNLQLEATSTDGSDTATTNAAFTVTVAGVADAPTLSVEFGTQSDSGETVLTNDYGDIGRDETVTKTYDFGAEHAGRTVTIEFDGTTFGGWESSGGNQDYLYVTANGSEILNTSASGTTSHSLTATLDGNGQLNLEMFVDATASHEGMSIGTVTVTDPEPLFYTYPVEISNALTDTDGSESLSSVTISGVPSGVTLSPATDNGGGSWTVTQGDLASLEMVVPGGTGEFDLSVSVTATDTGGDTETTTVTLRHDPVAGDVTLTTSDAAVSEDQSVALDVSATLADTDGSETLSITISGIPSGATLVNSDGALTVSGGSVTLTADQLDGLAITPPADSGDDFQLTVTTVNTESMGGATNTETATIDVSVTAVADAPTLDASVGSGTETNGVIFHFALEDVTSGSNETVTDSVNGITGTAKGDTYSATGTDGNAARMDGSGDYIEVAHDASMELSAGSFSIDFNPSGDNEGTLASKDSSNYDDGGHFDLRTEDGTVYLRVQTDTTSFYLDGGNVSGSGFHNATVTWDGTTVSLYVNGALVDSVASSYDMSPNHNPWTFGASQQASGDNTADNLRDYFQGRIDNPVLIDGALTADQVATLYSGGIADYVANNSATGMAYDLDITTALTDTDGSESLSAVTITGVPSGVTLDPATDNGGGSWTVAQSDLANLSITVPDGTANFDMAISVTATDTGGDTETQSYTYSFDTSSGTLTLQGTVVSATEDQPVALDIAGSLSAIAEGDITSVTINGANFGFGVTGAASGDSSELGYDSTHGVSEELIVDFDNDALSVDVALAWAHSSEQAAYELFRDGVSVGSGTITGVTDGIDPAVTLSADGGVPFDQIVFTASGVESDYLINSIEFQSAPTDPFDLTINAVATESDGGDTAFASATLSVDPGEVLTGDDSSAIFSGTDGDDVLDFANVTTNSVDTIDAGDGNDVLDFANATLNDVDQISGGGGDDVLDFSSATLNNVATIDGGAGADRITGSLGDDNLYGGDGNDRLDGGGGSDLLTGGAGDDTFVLNDGAVDNITDFNSSDDTLDLITLGSGDDISNYLQIEDDGSGNSVVKVDTGGGGDNFQSVAVLEGVTGLDVQQLFNSGKVVVDEG